MHGLLQSHRAAVVFFTSETCGPCKLIEPIFEELAHRRHGPDGGRTPFVKVDMSIGSGGQVSAEWSVRVTPTFLFFLGGNKQYKMKGVNAPELRYQASHRTYVRRPVLGCDF